MAEQEAGAEDGGWVGGHTDQALRSVRLETLVCPGIHLRGPVPLPNSTLRPYAEGQL